MGKRQLLFLLLAAIIAYFSGHTGGVGTSVAVVAEAPQSSVEAMPPPPEQPPTPPAVERQHSPTLAAQAASVQEQLRGGGELAYASGTDPLDGDQEALLAEYMNAYYTSLALLEPQDLSRLFVEGAWSQLENELAVLATLTGIRAMQQTDLTLTSYSFQLTVQSATVEEGGGVRIRAQEDNIQNFTAYPGVDSAGYDIGHTFLLTETGQGWRIGEHRQMGSLNRLVMGLGRWQPGASAAAPTGSASTGGNVEKLLADTRAAVTRRAAQSGPETAIRCDNAYDRAAAADYARSWAKRRNPDWPSYDRMGGNCQNFTSQAILAGGIPMDHTSPGQWKWYGDTPSTSFQASGRSPAWSGVREFLSYVQSNSGYGMVALAGAPYYSGEAGDVIHMGVDGDLRHTVMITDVLKDENGRTVDYLIASNTANLRDFPASAYYYADQTLIKIYGWNNG